MRLSLRLLSASTPKPTPPRSRLANLPTSQHGTPPLSLEHFLQRSRALSLYRTILRSLFRIPKSTRSEPIAWARGEFERNRGVKDVQQIRYLISTGRRSLKGWGDMWRSWLADGDLGPEKGEHGQRKMVLQLQATYKQVLAM